MLYKADSPRAWWCTWGWEGGGWLIEVCFSAQEINLTRVNGRLKSDSDTSGDLPLPAGTYKMKPISVMTSQYPKLLCDPTKLDKRNRMAPCLRTESRWHKRILKLHSTSQGSTWSLLLLLPGGKLGKSEGMNLILSYKWYQSTFLERKQERDTL